MCVCRSVFHNFTFLLLSFDAFIIFKESRAVTCCDTVVLSFLCELVQHVSLYHRQVTFFIIQRVLWVDSDFSCRIHYKATAGSQRAIASTFDWFQLVDQGVISVFVVPCKTPNSLSDGSVLLHCHRRNRLELRPLIVHIQHAHLHHHFSFLLFQICCLHPQFELLAITLIVKLNVWVHGDFAPVTTFICKGANDEAAKASINDPERNAVKVCRLVQILSVNRTNIYTWIEWKK